MRVCQGETLETMHCILIRMPGPALESRYPGLQNDCLWCEVYEVALGYIMLQIRKRCVKAIYMLLPAQTDAIHQELRLATLIMDKTYACWLLLWHVVFIDQRKTVSRCLRWLVLA